MLKNSFWTALSSGVYAIQSFVTTKLFSIYFGPQGVTLLSHFQNIIAIFITIPSEGINKSVVRNLAQKNCSQSVFNATISSSLTMTFVCYLVSFVFFLCFLPFYINDFPRNFFFSPSIILVLFAIILHLIVLFIGNLFLASSLIKTYSILGILNNILAVGITYIGLQFSVQKALLFVAFSHCSLIFLMYYFYRKEKKNAILNFKFKIEKSKLKDINAYLWTAISVVAFGKLTDFFVRSYIISTYNLFETGLWQAVSKISDGYTTVFLAAFSTLIFVKFSSLIEDKKSLAIFLKKVIISVFMLSLISLSILYYFRILSLEIFYNHEFIAAERLFKYQCIGDLFKFPFLIMSNLLLVQMRVKIYIILQAISACIYIVFIYILSQYMDINSMNVAHAIRWVSMCMLVIFLYKDILLYQIEIEK